MAEKYDEQYLELLNSIYFKLQSNKKIKQNIENSELYNDFVEVINILYNDRANIYDNGTIKYNIKHFVKSFGFIDEKTNHLSDIRTYNIELLKNMKQIVEYQKEAYSVKTISNKIIQDEFSIRYDKLLDMLSTNDKNPNLTINTIAENRPFKLIKNSNNQITAIIGNGTKISLTKEALINRAYNSEEHSHPSYADTLIQTIFDNTVFDYIQNESLLDFSHMPEERIKKLEEKSLQILGQISEIEKINNERADDYQKLTNIIHQSNKLNENYVNAKQTVLNDIKLQKSYKFWEIQSKRYETTYYWYLLTAVIQSLALIIFVYYFFKNNIIGLDTIFTWQYPFLIFVSSMGIWATKIIVKFMLSNYHLSVDANERVIMIRTYLALLKEGKGFESDDKKVMLDNIFRPTNHGIIKDETSITVADVISSLKK